MNSWAWPRSSLQSSLNGFFVDKSTSDTIDMVMVWTNYLKWCSVYEERVHIDSGSIGLGLGFHSSFLLDDVEVNRRQLGSNVHCSCLCHSDRFLTVSYDVFCPPALLLVKFGPN